MAGGGRLQGGISCHQSRMELKRAPDLTVLANTHLPLNSKYVFNIDVKIFVSAELRTLELLKWPGAKLSRGLMWLK